jgi:hydrogenase expression/formation protein HypE
MNSLLSGKVPPDVLASRVFKHLVRGHADLILGPAIGQDASLIRIGDRIVVASTDPITGSVEDIGWLSVHVNANDIATFGVAPKWFLSSIMLPLGFEPADLEMIVKQMKEAANSIGIIVAGGHTEVTDEISKPIIAGFMLGETEQGQYVTSAGAKAGDSIIMTKTMAIEGTAILAAEGVRVLRSGIAPETVVRARKLREQISVVKDGITAFKTGFVTAMHDPTEGGLVNGIYELCEASGVGFHIDRNHIPIDPATQEICDFLSIDPLELISSGTMLITCRPENASHILEELKNAGIGACEIGHTDRDPAKHVLEHAGKETDVRRPLTDALWAALEKVKGQ